VECNKPLVHSYSYNTHRNDYYDSNANINGDTQPIDQSYIDGNTIDRYRKGKIAARMLTNTQTTAMLVATKKPNNKYYGDERDKYLWPDYRELRNGATQ
jgi:hypothetical protein